MLLIPSEVVVDSKKVVLEELTEAEVEGCSDVVVVDVVKLVVAGEVTVVAVVVVVIVDEEDPSTNLAPQTPFILGLPRARFK